MTLERSYRVNLRCDIKDCRIASGVSTPPRSTDRLSISCLDTCCFLATQLNIARKPPISAPSRSSNMWSCPSVHSVKHLGMATDLCGYGDKWRKRTGVLMGWIDSRDRHRFEKHCFTTKSGNCSFLHSKHFSRCPPTQSSMYPALFVDALAFVLTTSASEQPSSSLIRAMWCSPNSCSRSLELHARKWPLHVTSCFSPCQASCSQQLFSLSHTAKTRTHGLPVVHAKI